MKNLFGFLIFVLAIVAAFVLFGWVGILYVIAAYMLIGVAFLLVTLATLGGMVRAHHAELRK